jgi:hypothetical protein
MRSGKGRPAPGAHQQHWDQATAEIDGEDAKPKSKAAKPVTARTKAGPKPAAAAKASKPRLLRARLQRRADLAKQASAA